jgi:hypothetical protein
MTRPVNSSAQRAELSRRIDQLLEEEHQRPSTPPSPLDSEGTRSARVINKQVPVTNDPYLLRDNIPVLRLVGSPYEHSEPEPVPFVAQPESESAEPGSPAWRDLAVVCMGVGAFWGLVYWGGPQLIALLLWALGA